MMGLARISLLTLASAAGILAVQAQERPSRPDAEIDRCIRWMKATVAEGLQRQVDPADFCAGVKRNNVGGWASDVVCGNPPQVSTGTPPTVCSSQGQITESETWAVGFSSSSSSDGRDLLADSDGSVDAGRRASAVVYTRTATWLGDGRISPGMYRLVPSRSTARSAAGWRLAVFKESGELVANAALQQSLGPIEATANEPTNHLLVWIKPVSNRCPGPSWDIGVREVHFIYGNKDLFFCVRPDQVPLDQEASAIEPE